MPNIDIMFSDDYAVVEDAYLRFYYGYEETVDGDWCFVVTQKRTGHEVCRYSATHLLHHAPRLQKHGDEPAAYLMVGMVLFYEGR